ncbi:MAG: hypothetical protein OZ921_00675 [Sorangiineae bacterium]|nr:hypothetical protein [Polyangiaceae bacterium]MEB2320997.1 hypothetical protein [Sorangiineae bacterium]
MRGGYRAWSVAALIAVVGIGCDGGDTVKRRGQLADASTYEASVDGASEEDGSPDAAPADAALPDGAAPADAALPDGAAPADAALPDGGAPADAALPDGAAPADATLPDGGAPADAALPDGGAPADAALPDGGADAGVVSCPDGFADCDADPTTCETDVRADALNCGRCGRACGGTAACANRLCAATTILDPSPVYGNWCAWAFTSTEAYMINCWGNNVLSEVRSAPLEPGANVAGTRIQAWTNVSVVALRGIFVEGSQVYFGLEANPSHIWTFPVGSDGPEDVTSAMSFPNGERFDSLQHIGGAYYYIHNTTTAAGTFAPATIKRRGDADAGPTVLVSNLGPSGSLQVTGTHLWWVERHAAASTSQAIYRAPLAGGAAELVGSAGTGTYLHRQDDYMYWTDNSGSPNGRIRRAQHTAAGVPVVTDVVTGLNGPDGFVTDATYAYFKQHDDALYRVPLAGGVPEQLSPPVPAHDTQSPMVLHVDDQYVYFAAGGFGTSVVMRVAK